jgi:hypothetical protein
LESAVEVFLGELAALGLVKEEHDPATTTDRLRNTDVILPA